MNGRLIRSNFAEVEYLPMILVIPSRRGFITPRRKMRKLPVAEVNVTESGKSGS